MHDCIGCSLDALLYCRRDWHTGNLLCKQKSSADHLSSVVFTEDSSHVLAAGKASLKVSYQAKIVHATLWRQAHQGITPVIKQVLICTSVSAVHNAYVLQLSPPPFDPAAALLCRCLQSWSLSWASPRPNRRKSSGNGTSSGDAACSGLSLTARQVNLKQQRQANFVDMHLAPCAPGQPAGSNGVYALTDKGTLLLLRSTGRTVDRSINLEVGSCRKEGHTAH
jgi:hypothetical protein